MIATYLFALDGLAGSPSLNLSISLKYTNPHASDVAGDMVRGSTPSAFCLARLQAAQQHRPRQEGHCHVLLGSCRLGGAFSW